MTKADAIEILRCRKDGDAAEALEVVLKIAEAELCDTVIREIAREKDKVNCDETTCNNCINHNYCDYEDAVSREAVLQGMYDLCNTGETLKENPWRDNPHIDAIIDTIENLPPVAPNPCEDAVSREFMYKLGAKCIAARNENGELVAITSIESLPPVTPKQRTGKWIETTVVIDEFTNEEDTFYVCGCCNERICQPHKYCPNCGAKMEGMNKCRTV